MDYIFTKSEINEDTQICQYMDFDYLISLLEKKKYYVKLKNKFDDKHEQELPMRFMYPVHLFGETISKEKIAEESRMVAEKQQEFNALRKLPASCWSMFPEENALMWKCYTTKIGACVRTTVSKFLESLDCNNYSVYCGKMTYEGFGGCRENGPFSKDRQFVDERELRFYFVPLHGVNENEKDIEIPVNPSNMITEIILSPRIKRVSANAICKILKEKYDITVRVSSLEFDG